MKKKKVCFLMLLVSVGLLGCLSACGDTSNNSNTASTMEASVVEDVSDNKASDNEATDASSVEEKTDTQVDDNNVSAGQDGMEIVIDEETYNKWHDYAIEAVNDNHVEFEAKTDSDNISFKEGCLFVTKDGVECTDIRINVMHDDDFISELTDGDRSDRFSFVFFLDNHTDSPLKFDTSLFTLETSSGELVDPCVDLKVSSLMQEGIANPFVMDVKPEPMCMTCMILNSKDMAEDDNIRVYYDGMFITEIPVLLQK